MRMKDLEKVINMTLEDIKSSYKRINPNKTALYIPLDKIGNIRYFIVKNFKIVEESLKNENR